MRNGLSLRRLVACSLLVASSLAFAQSPPSEQDVPPVAAPTADTTMQAMEKMATTVTRMAEVCEMMMKQEMALAPFRMAALAIVGVLLLINLALLPVLQVQLIRYWTRRLKHEYPR
jgi:hypothetical protein